MQKLPRIYQTHRTKNLAVEGHYWIDSSGRKSKQFAFGFDVGHYEKQGTLTIDPQIAFSTFLGGSAPGLAGASDTARGIAVDSSGSAYVAGSSVAIDFPTTLGAYDMDSPFTGFVTKFSPDGSQLVYSTFIGGTIGCGSIAVDSSGVAYVMCGTDSKDLPTVNPFQAKLAGGVDGAYLKLSADGSSLLYCTYFGGSGDDGGAGMAIDGSGDMYIAGLTNSRDFPIRNAIQTSFAGGIWDGFVAKLNNDGNDLVYSTYLGGSSTDGIGGIALKDDGAVCVSGQTTSIDFPVTAGAFQTVYKGIELRGDAFVAKLAPGGASLVYSTYLGGTSYEGAGTIAVDGTGAAYIAGMTSSTDFPIMNPIQPTLKGFSDAFVTKLSPDGSSLVYSTFLGGGGVDGVGVLAVDATGAAYVAGYEESVDFPTVDPLPVDCSNDGFVTKLNPAGNGLIYSTCLGGNWEDAVYDIAVDAAGSAYVTGYTFSPDFPIHNAVQPYFLGNNLGVDKHAFVTKLQCDSIDDPQVLENGTVGRL